MQLSTIVIFFLNFIVKNAHFMAHYKTRKVVIPLLILHNNILYLLNSKT